MTTEGTPSRKRKQSRAERRQSKFDDVVDAAETTGFLDWMFFGLFRGIAGLIRAIAHAFH